ncbi:hypothetical protein MLD38_015634 [Melastoma candidum]|uniref:Uncharacterized protein n=1 Tax=Melastoma candidum TaxID=119954 RepID=A0ACB9RIN1_9MYRT|nr:hypothetical protein MLD38_015634 [Melastoma candidum]
MAMKLPLALVESIVSLTTPSDACRAASVSSTFRLAADSDAVWIQFFPSDYMSLVERAVDLSPLPHAFSLKDLYLRLCNGHVLIDGGSLSFWLDRWSGKKCYMIPARALAITWCHAPQYWKWIPVPESRFPLAAELVNVCWLDIIGTMDMEMLSPDTCYTAYLVFKLGEESNGFTDAVDAEVGVIGTEHEKRLIYLDTEGMGGMLGDEMRAQTMLREDEIKRPRERKDGWVEVEMGEVFSGGRGEETRQGKVGMRVREVNRLDWKSGIIIQGIEIRPKVVV